MTAPPNEFLFAGEQFDSDLNHLNLVDLREALAESRNWREAEDESGGNSNSPAFSTGTQLELIWNVYISEISRNLLTTKAFENGGGGGS